MAVAATWAPQRQDIVWIDCNPQAGREMKDMHPLLVLSPGAFNARTSLVIGCPMTTAAFNETNPFAVRFEGPKKVVSYVLAHQPKSFDWRARGAKVHPWKRVSDEVFEAVCEQLNQIISICE
jgi:mRNA interferase MazF